MAVFEAVAFTSRAEIEDLMSSLGVVLHTDESPDTIIPRYVSIGTSDVLFFCQHAGTPAELAQVPWVRDMATLAAARKLSGFGGEPMNETLQSLWDEAKEYLNMVLAKEAAPPGINDVRGAVWGGGPVVVNRVINAGCIPNSQVVRAASTDVPNQIPQPTSWAGWWPRGWPWGIGRW